MIHLLCVFLILLNLMLFAQVDKANQEIVNLNSQVAAFEVQAGKESDTIAFLKAALLKRSHPKKKVICLDFDHVA